VHQFELRDGSFQFAQQKTALNAKGRELRARLSYNPATPSYQGDLSLDVDAGPAQRPPLTARVQIPLEIMRDAIRIRQGKITTPQSALEISCAVEHMKAPVFSARANMHVSLRELEHAFGAGMAPGEHGAPSDLYAEASIKTDEKSAQVSQAR